MRERSFLNQFIEGFMLSGVTAMNWQPPWISHDEDYEGLAWREYPRRFKYLHKALIPTYGTRFVTARELTRRKETSRAPNITEHAITKPSEEVLA